MLWAIVEISDAMPYDKWRPDTPLRDEPWLMNNWLKEAPSPENEDAWSEFIQENPPPSACCLYFIEVATNAGSPRLVYIGSIFRQSVRKRLRIHHVNARLVNMLQKSPDSYVSVRYGYNIYADYTGGALPPDPEPLWAFPEDEQEEIIRDVEAALIFKLQPEFNTRNKKSYRGRPICVELWKAPWPGIPTGVSFTLNPDRKEPGSNDLAETGT